MNDIKWREKISFLCIEMNDGEIIYTLSVTGRKCDSWDKIIIINADRLAYFFSAIKTFEYKSKFYNVNNINKFYDLTEDEIKAINRDIKIDEILND